jgi:serine/threonine protein kinase
MSTHAIGKIQILGNLGAGAHSKILHIRCSGDGKQYALKVVPIDSKEDQKFQTQAEHEFRVAHMLNHPNIIKVYTLEKTRDWLFRVKKVQLLIEYVNGKTLDNVPRLSIPRLVQVFSKIAGGLYHMHRRGVYHADLKPNNVLLSRTGEVKIIDFGLAWIKGEPKDRVQGTPEYMAPEQAKDSTVNEQSDIYNFGATMYRLVTWRHPPSAVPLGEGAAIGAKTFKALLRPVEEFTPTAPKGLCELIHHCLEYSAKKRPEKASDVQARLDKLADELVRTPEDSLENMEW